MLKSFCKQNIIQKTIISSCWLFIAACCLISPNAHGLMAASTLNYDYPRLANLYLKTPLSESDIDELAKWDVIVLGMQEQSSSPDIIKAIRAKNPQITILAYVASQEFPESRLGVLESADGPWHKLYAGIQSDWWLYKSNGERFSSWPGNYSLNVASGWNEYLANFMHNEVMSTGLWDGLYYDNVWDNVSWVGDGDMDMNRDGVKDSAVDLDTAWLAGMKTLLKTSRNLEGQNTPILGNGGDSYHKYLNGRLFENFPQLWPGIWQTNMEKYFDFQTNGYMPTLNILNGAPSNQEQASYQQLRFDIASTLLGDGFLSYDKGSSDHSQLWWYDEFDAALGQPISAAYNILNSEHPLKIQNGVWRRDFAQGTVLLNTTSQSQKVSLEKGLEKINGTQDPEVNNGTVIGSVTIPKNDGIILLGRITSITYAPFVNGSYSKILNRKGQAKRNSFFSYDSNYSGNLRIVKLPDVNKVVVAGLTNIQIYKNNKLVYQFAPYGSAYSGGINIAVSRLYSKTNKGKYYIVTGSQTGGQIRIFDMNGELKNAGIFPYGKDFKGGVSVAVGKLNKYNKSKQIITAPGVGGGPQINIYNNKFKLLRPGFMAYSSSLRTGINVAAGDINKDGQDEIVTGTNLGAGPQVRIFKKNGKLINSFYSGSASNRGGVLVAVSDADGDGVSEIITSNFNIYGY